MNAITPEVCISSWMFAEKYQLPQLADRARTMASEAEVVVESGEITQLPKSMLLEVLSSQETLSMDDTCRTILRWVEADIDSRQDDLEDLLPFVSFPQLSHGYILELLTFYDQPIFKHISEKVHEAVSFNLQDQTPELRRQILAKQDRVTESPLVKKCAVVLACLNEDVSAMSAFHVEPEETFYSFPMECSPEAFHFQFTTCVHRNELYVSRGTKQKTVLTKYVPGNNDWEILPPLEFGVEKHSMSAVGDRLFLIGGSRMCKKSNHYIPCYNIGMKTWNRKAGELQVDVEDASTAVLGHRIYVFGGSAGLSKPVDTVQCVDTRSGHVYVAGCLPVLTEDVKALSDGGTIYVLCDGMRVLKMKEHFELADTKESPLKRRKMNNEEDQPDYSDSTPSVSFLNVGTFSGGKVLAAYLHSGEMIGCGTVSSDGVPSSLARAINLETGAVTTKRLAFQKPLKNVNTLNIPQEFLNQETASAHFRRGDMVQWKRDSQPAPAMGFGFASPNNTGTGTGTVEGVSTTGTVSVKFPNGQIRSTPASKLVFAGRK
ncbi:kelch-like protein 24a isoform X2 [Babylonia areolata]